MMYGFNGSGMWIMMLVVFLAFVLLFGLFAVFGGLALRHTTSTAVQPAPNTTASRALSILDERLARGEITPQEYQQLRDTLAANSGSGF